MSEKTWKDALLATGQPLEHSVARILADANVSLSGPREYGYVKSNENGVPTEFSVDLHTSQMGIGNDIAYWVDYLIECKYRRDGTRWVFTPEDYDGCVGPCLRKSLVTLDSLADDYRVVQDHLESFAQSYTYCSRGCELFGTERHLAGIDQAINQLKYAVPNLAADAIEHQSRRLLGPKAPIFIIVSIVVTTAELWCLKRGTTIESIRGATDLADVAERHDILILYQPPDNLLERYSRSVLKARFAGAELVELDERLKERGRHSFDLYTDSIARECPSYFLIVHYSRFQQCVTRLTSFVASKTFYERRG